MKFHKEGYSSLAITVLFILVLNAFIQFFWPDATVVKWIIYILSFALFVIIVQFFRSPKITLTKGDNQVVCPADGKVVVIEETTETEFLKDRRIQLSVFMSPVNVHINRNPISGVVKYFKYHPGKYLVAWHPKSSTENERTTVVIENSAGVQVLFRQIAGALARRIVWYVKEGDKAEQGDQFGFIKFGSRVDLFLPLGTKINVNIGDVVKGGRTVLAELVTSKEKATEPTHTIPDLTKALSDTHGEPTLVVEHPAPAKPAVKTTASPKPKAVTPKKKKE